MYVISDYYKASRDVIAFVAGYYRKAIFSRTAGSKDFNTKVGHWLSNDRTKKVEFIYAQHGCGLFRSIVK